jgi:uncharacterized membrane protein YhfC
MLELVYFLNGLLMAAMPLALGAWIARRWSVDWSVFGVGALAFAASQVLHLPFNHYVLLPLLGADQDPQVLTQVIGALAVGLSAGFFEELARYIAMWRMSPRRRSFAGALMFGAGHGGLEAIVLGGAALYALLRALTLRNADLAQVVGPERLDLVRAQLQAFWSAPVSLALMGALERASALMLHLFSSGLVMLSVGRRKVGFLLLAILTHTLFNAVALLSLPRAGVYGTEALLLVIGLACLFVLSRLGKFFPQPAPPAPAAQAGGGRAAAARSEKADPRNLDDSRYI